MIPDLALPPCVRHEDDHLLVVNKPAGWNTHAPSPYAGEGIYDWLRNREPRWATLAILHRLDKETSGLLVFGKTAKANRSMTEQFTRRVVGKRYVLETDREVVEDTFTVCTPIRRAGDQYQASLGVAGAKSAETRFRVVRRRPGLTVLHAEPVTGRTHQIRVHAAERGFPLLGDVLYGGTPAARVHLHAMELRFTHPGENREVVYTAEVDFGEAAGVALRRGLIDSRETDSFRWVHGAADGSPGCYIDRLGPFAFVQSEREGIAPTRLPPGTCGWYIKRLERRLEGRRGVELSPRHGGGEIAVENFVVRENGVQFELSFQEGYSVGLFLDQRDNRRRLLTGHVGGGFPLWDSEVASREILNCFAYTCGFSVCGASGGAKTTSLDLSRKYLEWGRRNFLRNGIDMEDHEFIHGDTFDWLRRFARKGRRFGVVVLDPPTFSRSKECGVFRADADYGLLVTAALQVLSSGGVLLSSTNAARVSADEFIQTLRDTIRLAGRKIVKELYIPQPPDFPVHREEPAHLKTVWMRVA
ncbi:MAG: hypothetical protein EXS36_10590 [Pedosphaera sp.]|nr:hypothetical protein [Pedosphaera sp.]